MDIIKIFGTNLRNYRKNINVSQEKFAEICGLHRTYISDIERFKRSISLENIQRIANALNIETYKLFIESEEKNMISPYDNKDISEWAHITENLISEHPLDKDELVEVVLEAWEKILSTKIGDELKIGVNIFPSPQIMGNFLHDLIPAILSKRYNTVWEIGYEKKHKDLNYIPNDKYSIEIKTSSQNKIYGNRSYGQESSNNFGKKKYGYYLAINFEKFTELNRTPKIKRIKLGWLDHSDWKSQISETGQNATLDNNAWEYKLLQIYPK